MRRAIKQLVTKMQQAPEGLERQGSIENPPSWDISLYSAGEKARVKDFVILFYVTSPRKLRTLARQQELRSLLDQREPYTLPRGK